VFVVVMDPGVGVQGEPLHETSAAETAKLVESEGGRADSSTASVTDPEELASLFEKVVEEHGSLDAVVNTAGILRFRNVLDSDEDDWSAVLGVHFDGYRNVLKAALPHMVKAASGRIVGFTSGVGLSRTVADSPAYGCAKRAVASLTWQLGRVAPEGVSINALSPIAASRMVRESLIASGMSPRGLDLSAMPQPDEMGPAAAYLASEKFGWSRGHVVFSGGSELSLVGPPRILEAVRTRDVADFAHVLDTVVPVVLTPVEAGQATTGGSNPRFGRVFDVDAGGPSPTGADAAHCLVVSDDSRLAERIARAITPWGMSTLGVGDHNPFDRAASTIPTDFTAVAETVERAASSVGGLDAVVVALGASEGPSACEAPWERLIDAHSSTVAHVAAHAAWVRAALRQSSRDGRATRLVHITAAQSPAARTCAQAVAQLARCANDTSGPAKPISFAVALESGDPADLDPLASLVARLVAAGDTPAIKGAELVIRPGWLGLRSHPGALSTASFGGPAIPDWVDAALREAVSANNEGL
jgi:NAD(P)-dependent dehydrogenase (short-subunit alcohol dehydrogenase family)